MCACACARVICVAQGINGIVEKYIMGEEGEDALVRPLSLVTGLPGGSRWTSAMARTELKLGRYKTQVWFVVFE